MGYLGEGAAEPVEKRQLEQVTRVDEQGKSHMVAEGFTVTVIQEHPVGDAAPAEAAPW